MRILDRIKRHWMGRQIWKAKMSEPLRARIVDEIKHMNEGGKDVCISDGRQERNNRNM